MNESVMKWQRLRFVFSFMSILIVLSDASSLIPITEITSELLPKTHERIIVPVDGFDREDNEPVEVIKPVHEDANETNLLKRKSPSPRAPRRVSDYIVHHHPHPPHPLNPNIPQPLHIDTSHFKTSRPNSIQHPLPSLNGKYSSKIRHHEAHHNPNKHPQEYRKKLNIAHLPKSPEDIPKTDWFDNTGKYKHAVKYGDDVLEPAEYANPKKSEKNIHAPENTYKSSFRGPLAQVTYRNGDGLGNFLYKSEVFFPNNNNNYMHPTPIIHQNPPLIHVHPTVHPAVTTHHFVPITTPSYEVENHHAPPTKIVKKPSTHKPTKIKSPKSEFKNSKGPYQSPNKNAYKDKEAQRQEEDYEYDDEDSDDDEGDNDQYEGPTPSDNDDDDEGDSRNNQNDDNEDDEDDEGGSSRENNSGEGSDEYDRAWNKYGYGRDDDESESGSYESSETRNVPQRIRFYHEKREEVKTPTKQISNEPESLEIIETSTASPPKRVKNVAISTKLNNRPRSTTPRTQAPKPEVATARNDKEVKSKDADNDDLKYFQ